MIYGGTGALPGSPFGVVRTLSLKRVSLARQMIRHGAWRQQNKIAVMMGCENVNVQREFSNVKDGPS